MSQFGGRITLINSVLSSLPIFYFSIFKAPAKVIEELERIRRRFLWAGGSSSSKICWISWDKVITPKKMGGLGVISLQAANTALLVKWLWRLKSCPDYQWAWLIRSLHEMDRVWKLFPVRSTLPGVWKISLRLYQDEFLTHSCLESFHMDASGPDMPLQKCCISLCNCCWTFSGPICPCKVFLTPVYWLLH